MKKYLIATIGGILFASLPLNGQTHDNKNIQDKDKAFYEEWKGNKDSTQYMKYLKKEELKIQELQKQNNQSKSNNLEEKTIQTPLPPLMNAYTNNKEKKDSAVYHIIRKGDNYYILSDYYWETPQEVDELERLNPGVDENNLKVGQKIRVK